MSRRNKLPPIPRTIYRPKEHSIASIYDMLFIDSQELKKISKKKLTRLYRLATIGFMDAFQKFYREPRNKVQNFWILYLIIDFVIEARKIVMRKIHDHDRGHVLMLAICKQWRSILRNHGLRGPSVLRENKHFKRFYARYQAEGRV
ncbi:MAG: hypothetical protein QW303_00520 [Nitrososphaerota archaeon]